MNTVKISDPRFNLREIVKNMILLEEHLMVPSKYCPDCIAKHLLTIEALADEANCLDNTGIFCHPIALIRQASQSWSGKFHRGVPPQVIGQEVRQMRKLVHTKVLTPEGIEDLGSFEGLSDHGRGQAVAWAILGLVGLAFWLDKRRTG